jgi:hypothetical protein
MPLMGQQLSVSGPFIALRGRACAVERAADTLHSGRINDHQCRKRDLNRVGDSSRVSKFAADRRPGCWERSSGFALFYAFQKLKNRGVESLRLLKLRKVTALVEHDLLGSRQSGFENAGMIRRNEFVLSSPNNQCGLVHCPHYRLKRRDLCEPNPAIETRSPRRRGRSP